MLPFIVLYFIVLIFVVLEIYYKKLKFGIYHIPISYISCLVIITLIIILGIFRYEFYGTDSVSYYTLYYKNLNNKNFEAVYNFNMHIDYGFTALSWFICNIMDSFWCYKTLLFLITFSIFFITMRKQINLVSLGLCVFISFFLIFDFTLLRQALAVNICFAGIKYLLTGKYFKYSLFIIFASLFHSTALICFSFIPFAIVANSKYITHLRIITLGSIYLVCSNIATILNLYPNNYSNMIGNFGENGGINALVLILFLLLWCNKFYLKYIKSNINETNPIHKIIEITSVSFFLQIISNFVFVMNRLIIYPQILFTILIPSIASNLKTRNKLIFTLPIIFLLCLLFFYQLLKDKNALPYIFVFDCLNELI